MHTKLLFTRRKSKNKTLKYFIKKYKLTCSYCDKTEYIYENNLFMMSVTKYNLFILLYNNNEKLEFDIKNYFYGE